MKRLYHAFCLSVGFLSLLASSCGNEDTLAKGKEFQNRLNISFSMNLFQVITTRSQSSAFDEQIQHITACTVDADGNILQKDLQITGLQEKGSGNYEGVLDNMENSSKVRKIHFFANCNPSFPLQEAGLKSIITPFQPVGGISEQSFPMWGTEIYEPGQTMSVKMLRSVVSSRIAISTNKLEVKEVSLHNANSVVNVCPLDLSGSAEIPTVPNPTDGAPVLNVLSAGSQGEFLFYFPEFKVGGQEQDRTCFVIEATYNGEECFYRIDFYRNGQYFLPVRNKKYLFNIVDVHDAGYSTKEDALGNPGANVQSKIVIEITENGNEIVTDGKYRFSIDKIQTAVLNPSAFLLTTMETDAPDEVQISSEQGTGFPAWLQNLRAERNGSYQKEIITSEGTMNITFYKWNLSGNFHDYNSIPSESPLWGARSCRVKLSCGLLEKTVGITQSLIPLKFLYYVEYVRTFAGTEIEVGTDAYDSLDLSSVKERYFKGVNLRPKPHRLNVWLVWKACSPNNDCLPENVQMSVRTTIYQSDANGHETKIKEDTVPRNVNKKQDGALDIIIDMPEVISDNPNCKNRIEIEVSSEGFIGTKLCIEQRFGQDSDSGN